jgi:NADH-quinone oxidoreductase subunit E
MKNKSKSSPQKKGKDVKKQTKKRPKSQAVLDEAVDLAPVGEIVARFNGVKGALIPVLQEVQGHYGYIPEEAVQRIARGLDLFSSSIYGVLTFYTQFNLKPKGKNMVRICCGTACHVKGVERVSSKFQEVLKIPVGETTEDRHFSLEQVACIGACSLAPAVMVNDDVHGKVSPDEAVKILEQYKGKAGRK